MRERMVSHYKLIERLGGGAMGTVYKAEDTILHRLVALKFLPANLTEDDEASRRFMREARATSSLDHPNICTTHEIAQAEDGSWYIAMAWYEGQTLRKIIQNGPVPPEQALDIARQAALGLSQAHQQKVVHRDIKPANIIVTDEGVVKILDFGLARLMGQARLTRTGTVMGTAAYMSPEQARGEDVGPRSDIWSLGAVLYEMLAGHPPFDGDSDVAVIYSVLNLDPSPLPEPVCRESRICTDIVRHCLARNPKERYPSAGVLAEDITQALGGSRPSHTGRPSGSSIFAPPRTRLWPRALAAVLALLVLAALALPRTREFLGSLGEPQKTGVAVTPFAFTGVAPADSALGPGLSTTINDQLSALEQYSDRFWVVPSTEVMRRELQTKDEARKTEGVDHVIGGSGTFDGSTITLNVTVFDRRGGVEATRQFQDFAGNLKTWQSDLTAWLTQVIDPDFQGDTDQILGMNHTNVPEAFLACRRGFGHLVLSRDGEVETETEAAVGFLESAVAADSSFACAWAQLGRAKWLEYRYQDPERVIEAEACLNVATRLDTTSVWAHYYLGDLETHAGNFEAARDHYLRALDSDPLHAPSLTRLARLYDFLGEDVLARELFERAVRIRPRYPRPYREAGVYHYFRAEYEQAQKYFEKIVVLAPEDYLGYYLLGAVKFDMEDYTASENLMRQALALKETFALYSNLATLYYYDQRYIDSITMCRKALELAPDDFGVWRTLAANFKFASGYADSVRPAYEKAMELVQVEMEKYPDDLQYEAERASFLANLGEPDQAREILDQLENGSADLNPDLMFTMASTYEELGERERALDWLEKALAGDISFKKVDRYPVLKNLRTHPRYIALRQQYEEK